MNAHHKMDSSATGSTSDQYDIKAENESTFSTFKVSPIKHSFQHHPLMQMPRLAQLAKELFKTKQCRFIVPNSEQHSEFDHRAETPDGRNIDEVFRRIGESGSWVALYNVETDPTYAAFLKEVTDSARHLIEPQQSDLFSIGGFIFISAPPSVTPFHIDRENNLWLQIAGRKIINVWDHTDRHVVAAADVDKFIVSGALDNVRLKDGFRERSHEFDVGPGDGVYFPSTSPHMTRTTTEWVRPDNSVSISIGVVFYTRHTYKQANIHLFNEVLRRRLSMQPRWPGTGGWSDPFKFLGGRLCVWLFNRIRGTKPSVGLLMPK